MSRLGRLLGATQDDRLESSVHVTKVPTARLLERDTESL